MMRIPIGGSDFDLAPWAYNEQPTHDLNLSNFAQLDDRDLKRVILNLIFCLYQEKKRVREKPRQRKHKEFFSQIVAYLC